MKVVRARCNGIVIFCASNNNVATIDTLDIKGLLVKAIPKRIVPFIEPLAEYQEPNEQECRSQKKAHDSMLEDQAIVVHFSHSLAIRSFASKE
ncbi:MAG TPA: hypothetical protein PLX64_13175 [Flavobacteriales bacterium]|nr:hypothetical protein [Flavobacteriales bacterium]HQZ93994.1 hypothetical protein [Flavobacteriales bacterium]